MLGANRCLVSASPGKQAAKYNSFKDDQDPGDWKDIVSASLSTAMAVSTYQFYNVQQLAGNKVALIDWLHLFKDHFADVMIWDKGHGTPAMAENVVNSRFEYVFIFSAKDDPSRAIVGAQFNHNLDNVYCAPRQTKNEYSGIHAATFPAHFPEHFVTNFTQADPCL